MKAILPLLLVLAIAAGCNFTGKQVTGSGTRKTERRDVAAFTHLGVGGAYEVTIQVGQAQSVEIEADDNILPLIETNSKRGVLEISNKDSFDVKSAPVIRITVPELSEINASGASTINATNIKGDDFKVESSGASTVKAGGDVKSLEVTLSGAGTANLQELRAQTVEAKSDGAGHITVYAVDSLDATANGAGGIDYYGNPKTVSQHVTGAGSVNKK